MKPVYCKSPTEFREWFEKNHSTSREILVGYYKTGSGRTGITWSDSVDAALWYGWIDGLRRSVNDTRYTIRFRPGRRGSIWSVVNIRKIAILTWQGLMRKAGLEVFQTRDKNKSGV
jgi:uncharacterized protein YdeI (YjbR/CyaY-like superfamily)